MGICCEEFGKHWIVFAFMQRFAWLPQGRPQGKQKMKAGVRKMAIFCNCGSNNWETVVDRRVHAARRFYHAMLCKRGLCCHAVSVCSSVCLSVHLSVTFVDHVKTNKHILEIFSPSGSHTILVWQTSCNTSTNLQNSITQFVSDSWASCSQTVTAIYDNVSSMTHLLIDECMVQMYSGV